MSQRRDEYSAPSFEPLDSPAVAVAEQPEPLGALREKPVVITGAAGFIGSHTCTILANAGWKVRAVVRDTAKAAERIGHLRIEITSADIRDAASMRSALKGAGSVVHLAAIAIEKRGASYTDTNIEATRTLISAAKDESVERIVYMSQNGADSRSPYAFLRSKGHAQDIVGESRAKWTILRPSVVFGPEDEFVNVLARLVRLSPLIYPLPAGGKARFQPVAVGDVARAILRSLEDDATIGRSFAIGGLTPLTLRQMTERILVAMNARRVLVGVPIAVLRPIIACTQRLLPSPPVTTELLDLIHMDNVIPHNDLKTELGISPTPFAPEELLYLREITISSAIQSLMRH